MAGQPKAFFSYSRQDSEFALKLAKTLRARGASIWIDQLDIAPGTHWDTAVQKAVDDCSILLVVLSPHSTESENVMDEVAYALDEKKVVIPVLYCECKVPLRLRRTQYIDVRGNYDNGIEAILRMLQVARDTLGSQQQAAQLAADAQKVQDQLQAEAAAKAESERQARQAQEQIARDQAARAAQEQAVRDAATVRRPPPPGFNVAVPVPPDKPSKRPLFLVLGGVFGVIFLLIVIGSIASSHSSPHPPAPQITRTTTPPDESDSEPGESSTSTPGISPPIRQQQQQTSSTENAALVEWLRSLVEASQGPNVVALLPYYSQTVSPYFGFPVANWAQIAADKQAYFNRFPQVHYDLVSWRYAPRPDGTEELDYTLSYNVVRADGRALHGISNVASVVRQEAGQWKIVAIQERN